MPGPGLPTGVVAGGTGHLSHTNAVHGIVNQFDTTLTASNGHVPVGDGTVFDNRALLSTDVPGVVTNSQSGNYTLVLADAGKLVENTSGSANSLTVPANASVAFPVGTVIGLRQYGTGLMSVTAAGGVTIRTRGGFLNFAGQYAEATLTKRATDEWVLVGDLA